MTNRFLIFFINLDDFSYRIIECHKVRGVGLDLGLNSRNLKRRPTLVLTEYKLCLLIIWQIIQKL